MSTFHFQQRSSKIEEIYNLLMDCLQREQLNEYGISLFEGAPGIALFLYQYAQYMSSKKKDCYAAINLIIEDAFDYISETPDVKISYCDGIIGILWLTQFLRKHGVIEMDADDIPGDMIQELSNYSLSQTTTQFNCDLLHGGFGFWAFLLASEDLPEQSKLIRQQLDALDKIKIPVETGMNWRMEPGIFQGEDQNNLPVDPVTSTHLGLAHGICSILVLLAKTNVKGLFLKETADLLHQGLMHLRSLKLKNTTNGYSYPMVVLNGTPQKGNRLAWCNGDLCVAQAFWMGWKATRKEAYKKEALAIVNTCIQLDKSRSGVADAGLCHGTAGIAQILRQFYWETNERSYALASDEWITETLKMASFPDGYAGFKTYRSMAYGGAQPEYGLLSGITGIGLTLLSSLSDKPTKWDSMLQIC